MLSASKIRVKMEALASMSDGTHAIARNITSETPVPVSELALMYIYKIYVLNLLCSGSFISWANARVLL